MPFNYEIVDSYELSPNVMGPSTHTHQYMARYWDYDPDYKDYHSGCSYVCGIFKPSSSYGLLHTDISQYAYGEQNNPGIESVGPITAELMYADENFEPIGSVLSTASFPELLDPETGAWTWTGGDWSPSITVDPDLWYCIRLKRFTPVSQSYRALYIGSRRTSSQNNKFIHGGALNSSKFLPYPDIPYPPPWVWRTTSYSFLYRNYAMVWSDIPTDLPTWPSTRPDDYDPDLIWTPGEWDGEDYTPPGWSEIEGIYVAAGGGRWSKQLVCVGQSKIYYESLV